jgi:hypothetical protein
VLGRRLCGTRSQSATNWLTASDSVQAEQASEI